MRPGSASRRVLQSASEHYRRQQRITANGLVAARRVRFDTLDRLLAVVSMFQLASAEESAAAVPQMLAEQGLTVGAEGAVVARALLGSASDGRTMSGLLDYTRSQRVTDAMFDRIVTTQLQDVARHAETIAMTAEPTVTGYVRVLNTPSCSRCVVLAGKRFRWNEGFQRHERCDCKHVPSGSRSADLTFDAKSYFQSIPEAEQNRIFTKAGAEAIRLGADPAKVVNARRGMSTTVTKSGRRIAARSDVKGQQLFTTTADARRGTVRLMPESILSIATDKADAVRLLKLHRYLA
jgi:hypothetical protein